jgi:diguanylate cyclase
VVSRFAGDEFMILCPDAGPLDAARLCRRIETALAAPIDLDGQPAVIGASIGTVSDDGAAVDRGAAFAEELIHRADATMYEAMHATRRRAGAGGPAVHVVVAGSDLPVAAVQGG